VWLAHALTLSRIPIAIALWSVWGQPAPAAALIALAALTDTADGRVARWAKRHGKAGPDIGGWLDPAVDKLFVAIVLAAIWVQTRQVELLVLLGAREIVLVPLIGIYVARRVPHRKLQADAWGKANLPRTARFLSDATGVPLAGTIRFLDRRSSGPVTVLKPADIADQQRVADAFSRAGLIPKPLNVADAVWQP